MTTTTLRKLETAADLAARNFRDVLIIRKAGSRRRRALLVIRATPPAPAGPDVTVYATVVRIKDAETGNPIPTVKDPATEVDLTIGTDEVWIVEPAGQQKPAPVEPAAPVETKPADNGPARKVLYMDDNGSVSCANDGGAYLRFANAGGSVIKTPRGTWTRVTATDTREWAEMGMKPMVCETCLAPALVAATPPPPTVYGLAYPDERFVTTDPATGDPFNQLTVKDAERWTRERGVDVTAYRVYDDGSRVVCPALT